MKDELDYLNWLLGEALEDVTEAAGEVRNVKRVDQERCLMGLGRVVLLLWSIREHLFEFQPELRTAAFRAAKENSKERFDEMVRLQSEALAAEENGDTAGAGRLFEELRRYAGSGFYRMVAEAGLYRLSASSGQGSGQ